MMPANPSSSRKGSSASQKLDLFGTFLDSPSASGGDLPMVILNAAGSAVEGLPYNELIRQVRKAGHSVCEFITVFKTLEGAELLKSQPIACTDDRLVLLTSAGKAAIGMA